MFLSVKHKAGGWVWGLTAVISAMWEAEVRGSGLEGGPMQKPKTISEKQL
jgi:hypothetical protein